MSKIIFSLPFFWALLATLITEQFHHGVVTTIAGLQPAEHKTVIKNSCYEEICVMALQDISIAVTSTHLELQLQQNGPYQPYHKCKGWMTLNICHLLSIANCCNYPSFHFTCLLPDKFVSWHIAIANYSPDNRNNMRVIRKIKNH